jgi:hypothetical protein
MGASNKQFSHRTGSGMHDAIGRGWRINWPWHESGSLHQGRTVGAGLKGAQKKGKCGTQGSKEQMNYAEM